MKHFITIMLIFLATAAEHGNSRFTVLRAVSFFNDLM